MATISITAAQGFSNPAIPDRLQPIHLPADQFRQLLPVWGVAGWKVRLNAADASGTLLFDVAGRRWSDEVVSGLELPAEWLPPVHESTAVAGAGDQQAAALGVGVVQPGVVLVVLGTSGVATSTD